MGRAQIMVLGTFHFHKEGVDYISIQSDQRQQEVLDVVNRISVFKPTKIAVECLPENETIFNEKYEKYLQDGIIDPQNINGIGYADTAEACNFRDVDERVMLGFQIGAKCGIKRLYAIDYMNEWLQEDALQYAQQHQQSIADKIERKGNEFLFSMLDVIDKPLNEILYFLNSPENISRQHGDTFLIYNQIGSSDDYIGTRFISSWYDRNLKIFSNIQRISNEDDRLLVIIGSGHCAVINRFIDEYSPMDFISPQIYLK
jgi:hypothetical protein